MRYWGSVGVQDPLSNVRHSVRKVCFGKHKVEFAQRSLTLWYVVLEFVCLLFLFHYTKVQNFPFFVL